jgi:ubiquinone/menaquinone biosynthesis C-methylase UbiE
MKPAGESIARVRRSRREARDSYDRLSRWYDLLAGRSERKHAEAGLGMLAAREGESILEVGSGTGHGLVSLARSVGEAGKVVGADVSRGMMREARRKVGGAGVPPCVKLCCADGEKLPFRETSFDGVFMSFTLELFDTPDIPAVLDECFRVLRPGGRICVVTMAGTEKPGVMVRLYMWFHEKLPALADCRPILAEEAMRKAGFRVRDVASASMWGLPVGIVLAEKPS